MKASKNCNIDMLLCKRYNSTLMRHKEDDLLKRQAEIKARIDAYMKAHKISTYAGFASKVGRSQSWISRALSPDQLSEGRIAALQCDLAYLEGSAGASRSKAEGRTIDPSLLNVEESQEEISGEGSVETGKVPDAAIWPGITLTGPYDEDLLVVSLIVEGRVDAIRIPFLGTKIDNKEGSDTGKR